ncbi:MAG: hypothetical protein ACAI43_26055 [Phycisphaerae bacterium]|nr:hypothetical protein [Tepidisphaeraceae bacterium]
MTDNGVRFVLIGGYAAIVHGSPIGTEDVDVCAPLDEDNLARILAAVADLHPRFRMRPDKPPVPTDPGALKGFKNLYLHTDLGPMDFLSEVTGIGGYDEVSRHTVGTQVGGYPCRVLDLDGLIRSKRAVGRPKDLRGVAELEAIRRRLEQQVD